MKKLLIACTGETARQIIATAKRMGIATVALTSEQDPCLADADSIIQLPAAIHGQHGQWRSDAVLKTAREAGADAVHPGDSLLAAHAGFADQAQRAGLVLVGPSAAAIRSLGLRDAARTKVKATGVPVVPGHEGQDQSLAQLERMAQLTGYPLFIRSAAGQDRGISTLIPDAKAFTAALLATKREASARFGNDAVTLEKQLSCTRLISVPIFGDQHGNLVHLPEVDLSLQQDTRQLLCESPAPGLSADMRHMLGIAAITIAHAAHYQGAGSVQFLLTSDENSPDAESAAGFHFLSATTGLSPSMRLSALACGVDPIEWQLRIAKGDMLPLMQDAIEIHHHAIAANLHAAQGNDGTDQGGFLQQMQFPEELQVEAAHPAPARISSAQNPLLARLLLCAANRTESLERMTKALDQVEISGIASNRALLARLVAHEDVAAARHDLDFITRHAALLQQDDAPPTEVIAAIIAHLIPDGRADDPFARPFRLNQPALSEGAIWDSHGREYLFAKGPDGLRINGEAASAGPGASHDTILLSTDCGIEARRKGQAWRFFRDNPLWDNPDAWPEMGSDMTPDIASATTSADTEKADGQPG